MLSAVLAMVFRWLPGGAERLMAQTWSFQPIIPLLFGGVLVTGFKSIDPEHVVASWSA